MSTPPKRSRTAADLIAGIVGTDQLKAELLRRSLRDFVGWAWPRITGAELVPNHATNAVIHALQGVADGVTWRLLIAMPPGVGKSTLLACYAAWRRARDPGWRSINASHAAALAETESRRVRRLVEGDDFRRLFDLQLREDESTISAWATTANGLYVAIGIGGALTGRRAREAVVDDGLNAPDRFSKATRDALWAWFTESLSTRLDGDRAPMVVVGQRLDRDDLIGRLLEVGGWTLLELPAESDAGELVAPNVLGREKLDSLKAQIGSVAYATQYLQRPTDDSTALVKRAWWRFHRPTHVGEQTPRPAGCDTTIAAVPTPTTFERTLVAVDMTFGSERGDYFVAQCWGAFGAARYLLKQVRFRGTQMAQRTAIKELTREFPKAKVIIEKAAGGAGALEQLAADGISAVAVLPGAKSKIERLALVSPTIEAGHCHLPLGAPWLGDYVEELSGASMHDDALDTTSYSLAELRPSAEATGAERAYLSAVSRSDASDPFFVKMVRLRRDRGAPLDDSMKRALADVGEPVEG